MTTPYRYFALVGSRGETRAFFRVPEEELDGVDLDNVDARLGHDAGESIVEVERPKTVHNTSGLLAWLRRLAEEDE